ncbi:hypothetical protein BOVA435_4542 [Bacteroides ovatus]|nr:hypothetical protein BOVA435_4542 [Bacteroides ovatus]
MFSFIYHSPYCLKSPLQVELLLYKYLDYSNLVDSVYPF